MVVLIVDQYGIAVFEYECQPPIATDTDTDAPMVLKLPFEGMQIPTGNVHIRRRSCATQKSELPTEPGGMCRLNAGFTAGSEEALDAFVPERLDHGRSVACGATVRNIVVCTYQSCPEGFYSNPKPLPKSGVP